MTPYTPMPIDTRAVELDGTLRELEEKLARDCHENWAAQRIRDGWSYGPERDDTHRTHPCLVPYEELPEGEREYDRLTVTGALKLITSLGYRIVNAGDTGPEADAMREQARVEWPSDDLQIDEDAIVSLSDSVLDEDPGAWVAAWVWVEG